MRRQLLVLVIFGLFMYSVAKFHCEMGTPYKENNCNGCMCLGGQLLGCTEMACSNPEYKNLLNCKIGTIFQKACNTCACHEGLGTICTDKVCA